MAVRMAVIGHHARRLPIRAAGQARVHFLSRTNARPATTHHGARTECHVSSPPLPLSTTVVQVPPTAALPHSHYTPRSPSPSALTSHCTLTSHTLSSSRTMHWLRQTFSHARAVCGGSRGRAASRSLQCSEIGDLHMCACTLDLLSSSSMHTNANCHPGHSCGS